MALCTLGLLWIDMAGKQNFPAILVDISHVTLDFWTEYDIHGKLHLWPSYLVSLIISDILDLLLSFIGTHVMVQNQVPYILLIFILCSIVAFELACFLLWAHQRLHCILKTLVHLSILQRNGIRHK
jgi:hypothetical protein